VPQQRIRVSGAREQKGITTPSPEDEAAEAAAVWEARRRRGSPHVGGSIAGAAQAQRKAAAAMAASVLTAASCRLAPALPVAYLAFYVCDTVTVFFWNIGSVPSD